MNTGHLPVSASSSDMLGKLEMSIFVTLVIVIHLSVIAAIYTILRTSISVLFYIDDTASTAWHGVLAWAKQVTRCKVCSWYKIVLLLRSNGMLTTAQTTPCMIVKFTLNSVVSLKQMLQH